MKTEYKMKTREDIIKIQKDTMLCLAMHLPIHKQ